jgi:hypothetical protein
MKLSESINNNVRDYPLWALILGSVVMILLAIEHIICFMQSSKIVHIFFVLSLICLTVQYICAIQDINTAFLTLISDFFAVIENTVLLGIWGHSMEKRIDMCGLSLLTIIVFPSLLASMIFIILTMTEMDYSSSFEDNHSSREPGDREQLFLHITLITSITCSIILTLLTLIYQDCLDPKEYPGKRQKRLQLTCLSLLSLLLLVSKFGTLYEIPLLYIIPFLLFHAIPILKRDSITSYYYTPEGAYYAETRSINFFGHTR